jgi:hypothetical protein
MVRPPPAGGWQHSNPGNLKYDIDFRSVYQTLIRDWLQGDAATVLGATYPELPVINKAG